MERKKLIELIGSLFIAFIFLSSYAAFGSSSSSQNKSKPTTTIPIAIGTGFATFNIVNYTSAFTVTAACSGALLNATLHKLQASGAIADMVPISNNTFDVYSGNESAYALMQQIREESNCFNISATALVEVPNRLSLYIGALNRTLPVNVPGRLSQISLPLHFSNESKVNVSIMALVTLAGTIYQPNVTVYNMSVQVE